MLRETLERMKTECLERIDSYKENMNREQTRANRALELVAYWKKQTDDENTSILEGDENA